jgi:hypothetical protein
MLLQSFALKKSAEMQSEESKRVVSGDKETVPEFGARPGRVKVRLVV